MSNVQTEATPQLTQIELHALDMDLINQSDLKLDTMKPDQMGKKDERNKRLKNMPAEND